MTRQPNNLQRRGRHDTSAEQPAETGGDGGDVHGQPKHML